MKPGSNELIDTLIKDLKERPETFSMDSWALRDNLNCIRYWACGAKWGFLPRLCITEPFHYTFTYAQGRRFYPHLDEWKAWYAINHGA